MSSDPVQLISLFSTPLLLAYAVPLLLISILLTFTGAFLTLDRTRTFVPRSDAVEPIPGDFFHSTKKKRFRWLLEGGAGGLAGGYVFGLHASTFLALLIMNTTSSTPLGNATFLVVWLLSVTLTTVLAGRWKYAALACLGITGGATLSLSLCIILHPALLTRVVLISIFTPLIAVLALLPIPRTQHAAVRLSASSAGAFGTVLAIALLTHIPAWADAWERLWTPDSTQWGTAQERGLSAAFSILLAAGCACDWFLKRRFGENPDEKWDTYLADYAHNLPSAHSREGNFQPLRSWWAGLFAKHDANTVVIPPAYAPAEPLTKEELQHALAPDAQVWDTSSPPPRPRLQKPRATDGSSSSGGGFALARAPTLLQKPARRRRPRMRARESVQFRPVGGYSSSSGSSDSESDAESDALKTPRDTPPRPGPWPPARADSALSGTTLHHGGSDLGLGPEQEKEPALEPPKAAFARAAADAPEYSDGEDVATILRRPPPVRDAPGWTPGFLARSQPLAGAAPPGAVPATPSLLHALDRLAAAQHAAFGPVAEARRTPGPLAPVSGVDAGLPRAVEDDGARADRWAAFWRDVGRKAAEGVPA